MNSNQSQVRNIDGKQIRNILDKHINVLSSDVLLQYFLDMRQMALSVAIPREEQAAAYRGAVEAKAEAICVQAFDLMLAEVSKLMHTTDINQILPSLRKAGVRYHAHKVEICEGLGKWTSPMVFIEDAFVLVPVAKVRQAGSDLSHGLRERIAADEVKRAVPAVLVKAPVETVLGAALSRVGLKAA